MRDDVAQIVKAALGSEPERALSRMLQKIAELMDAFGCILWQTAPQADFTLRPPRGHLFVLASWFPSHAETEVCALHDLPLEASQTGLAVCDGCHRISNDVCHSPEMWPDDFLLLNQIARMLSVPVAWRSADGVRAALDVYAREDRVEFGADDARRLEHLVASLPALYRSVRDRLSFHLVQSVERIAHEAEQRAANGAVHEEDQEQVMTDICSAVAKAFHSLEVSVFLEDPSEPSCCKLMGTTWEDAFPRKTYFKRADEGIAGWALERGGPVRIFDLAHFARDRESIQRQYPDITSEVSPAFEDVVRRRLPQRQEGVVWPMSLHGRSDCVR